MKKWQKVLLGSAGLTCGWIALGSLWVKLKQELKLR